MSNSKILSLLQLKKDKRKLEVNHEESPWISNSIMKNYKFCKPHIALTRNNKHHHSIDNLVEEYPHDCMFANKLKI